MPRLKSNDTELYFDPNAIEAVADYDPDTMGRTTSVYGLGPQPVEHVKESAVELLTRLRIQDKFAQLTSDKSFSIWIRADNVSLLRKTVAREAASGAQTVVTMDSGKAHSVRDSLDDVIAKLKAAGTDLS
jgi:hypothetical protein